MIDNLLGGNDDEATADESDDEEMGGLFDDPGDSGAGGGDDPMDGGDDLMDGGDDLMDDDGDAGASNGETNKRIEELENEVDSLSSSVNTVKSENEQISESLDDVEENIRKLLEVYEMVTRGVNPFVDENELGDAFGGGGGAGGDGGSIGLFGGDEPQEESSDIDDAVADADADEFFDDDFEDGLDGDFEEGDGSEDVGGFEDDGVEGDDVEDEPADAGGGGKSFEELKSEYESGDAGREDDESADGTAEEGLEEGSGLDAPDATTGAGRDGAAAPPPDDGDGVEAGRPYLQELPAGFAADVVVMDWLEFLVEEGGVDGAARTLAYYEAIDWISESAAESLQTYLRGFGDGVEADPEPRSWLTVSHHNASLRFISRIDNPSMGMAAFDERSGHPWRVEVSDGTPDRVSAAGNGHGPQREFGTAPNGEPELESDGGRRTYGESVGPTYEPAASRRSRSEHSDENDSCGCTGEVGYGGFCWNHDED